MRYCLHELSGVCSFEKYCKSMLSRIYYLSKLLFVYVECYMSLLGNSVFFFYIQDTLYACETECLYC